MIEIKNMYSGYGRREILHEVSLCVNDGELVVILGPNASGKSTLFRTVMNIVPMSSGTITVDGESVAELDARALAKCVSYLPQVSKITDITVLELALLGRYSHLPFPRKYREEDLHIASDAVESVGLSGMEGMPISLLSGGMRQKAFVAMSISQSANNLLFDEPTAHLDVSSGLQIMQIMRNLADEGRAVAVVMHDVILALHTADKIAVMKDGNIVCFGAPEDSSVISAIKDSLGVLPIRLHDTPMADFCLPYRKDV